MMRCLRFLNSKLEGVPRLLKILESGCPNVWILFHDTNNQNHGQALEKIPWFFLNEIYTFIHWPNHYGKWKLRKFYENWGGGRNQIGNVCSFIVNKAYFCQLCGRH